MWETWIWRQINCVVFHISKLEKCCTIHLLWITDEQCCTFSQVEDASVISDNPIVICKNRKRGGGNHTLFTCTLLKKNQQWKFHISKLSNPTVWLRNSLKCHKYHFLVKRYTSFRGCQAKMAVPQWMLDNTNVSTVENTYRKTFFFVLEYLMHIKNFQKT